jgi:hypothetical protein
MQIGYGKWIIIKKPNRQQPLQRIWALGLMEKWFCIWDDLLRLFAISRVANPKIRINLVPKLL